MNLNPCPSDPFITALARRAPALEALRSLPRVTPSPPPAWAGKQKLFGTKSQGRAYEKKVGKVLKTLCDSNGWILWDHQWFVYTAAGQRNYFQPDFIVEQPGGKGLVVEAKLTYVDTTEQLTKYQNYLEIFGLTCTPVTAVRNLTPLVPRELIISEFASIFPGAVWHLWV